MSSEVLSHTTASSLTREELLRKAKETLPSEDVDHMKNVLFYMQEEFRFSPSSLQIVLGYL